MKKIKKAIVLTADVFRDEEVFYPLEKLKKAGWQVDVAAPKIEKLSGELGGILNPNKTIEEVDPDDYDLLFIPGGSPDGAPAVVRKIKKAQEITKSFLKKTNRLLLSAMAPGL